MIANLFRSVLKRVFGHTAYIRVRKTRIEKELFLAWGGLSPLCSWGPIDDECEPLYFAFGKTGSEASLKVAEEIKGDYLIKKFCFEIQYKMGPINLWKDFYRA